MHKTMITIRKLGKSFHQRPVVANLSFEAPDGKITGLLGANGAGKTTTLRMICGVLKPESGSIAIDEASGSPDSLSRQRRVGALLDHIGIYPRLTVRENLAYFGRLRNMLPALLEERLNSVISLLGLEAIANRRAAGFSMGERMKTALGRALIHSPKNLLLDEPTNGLDVPSVRSLRDLLRRLRDSGTCIVFSSHVLAEVQALCDNIVIISGGRLVAEGSTAELCSQTAASSLEEAFIKLTCPTDSTVADETVADETIKDFQ
jgi:sodium transport system ATP-binding protein